MKRPTFAEKNSHQTLSLDKIPTFKGLPSSNIFIFMYMHFTVASLKKCVE